MKLLSNTPPQRDSRKFWKHFSATYFSRRFGRPSFLDTFRRLREFQVGDMLKEIRCPCLALVGEGEGGEPEKQFKAFCEGVSGPVTA